MIDRLSLVTVIYNLVVLYLSIMHEKNLDRKTQQFFITILVTVKYIYAPKTVSAGCGSPIAQVKSKLITSD